MYIPWFTVCNYISLDMVKMSTAADWSILNICIRWIKVFSGLSNVSWYSILRHVDCVKTMYANITINKIIIIDPKLMNALMAFICWIRTIGIDLYETT